MQMTVRSDRKRVQQQHLMVGILSARLAAEQAA